MLLTQADIPVHWGIRPLSTGRVQMARNEGGHAATIRSVDKGVAGSVASPDFDNNTTKVLYLKIRLH